MSSYVRPGRPDTSWAARRFGMSTKRKLILAAVVWAALAAVPPPSDADSGSMNDEQIAALTCGHLGMPCPPAHPKRHRSCASASRAHARHPRRARAHAAQCRAAKQRRARAAHRRS
jgi:hypothetical protein